MKKFIALALAILTLTCLVACGPTADNGGEGKDTEAVTADAGEATAEAGTGTAEVPKTSEEPSGGDAEKAGLTGKLVFIDPDGEKIIRGLSLSGNRSGTAEFNSKEPATEEIRCIFELNEYVCVTPDTDETAFSVFVFKHQDEQNSYEKTDFSGLTDEAVAVFDSERDEDGNWGEFYLNPDDVEPGYYDLVFTVGGKAVASLVTRFYGEGELNGKTDAELEKLMKD